jgi:2,4-dienoyl-CoA reductase-like NADH-dependent reductase (Old Yellow Enzyme family)
MVVMLASPDGALTKRSMDYYVRYARGGVGLIIVEGTVRDEKEGKGVPSGFAIHNIGYVTGFNKIVKLVKDQGASIVLQIAIIGQGDLGWDSEEVRKQR